MHGCVPKSCVFVARMEPFHLSCVAICVEISVKIGRKSTMDREECVFSAHKEADPRTQSCRDWDTQRCPTRLRNRFRIRRLLAVLCWKSACLSFLTKKATHFWLIFVKTVKSTFVWNKFRKNCRRDSVTFCGTGTQRLVASMCALAASADIEIGVSDRNLFTRVKMTVFLRFFGGFLVSSVRKTTSFFKFKWIRTKAVQAPIGQMSFVLVRLLAAPSIMVWRTCAVVHGKHTKTAPIFFLSNHFDIFVTARTGLSIVVDCPHNRHNELLCMIAWLDSASTNLCCFDGNVYIAL